MKQTGAPLSRTGEGLADRKAGYAPEADRALNPKRAPLSKAVKPSPSFEEIRRASDVYRDWRLHYYQLLWFHEPKLTAPGRNSQPLSVEFDPDHWGCLKVVVPRNPDFNFKVLMYLHGKTQEEYDAEFLRRASLVVLTLNSGRQKVDGRACCPLATIRGCVCAISFDCEIHGQQCVGTYD